MTNALLILIVLILLFGAGTIRGAIGKIGAYVLLVLIGAFIFVGLKALFGESAIYWTLGLLLVCCLWLIYLKEAWREVPTDKPAAVNTPIVFASPKPLSRDELRKSEVNRRNEERQLKERARERHRRRHSRKHRAG